MSQFSDADTIFDSSDSDIQIEPVETCTYHSRDENDEEDNHDDTPSSPKANVELNTPASQSLIPETFQPEQQLSEKYDSMVDEVVQIRPHASQDPDPPVTITLEESLRNLLPPLITSVLQNKLPKMMQPHLDALEAQGAKIIKDALKLAKFTQMLKTPY